MKKQYWTIFFWAIALIIIGTFVSAICIQNSQILALNQGLKKVAINNKAKSLPVEEKTPPVETNLATALASIDRLAEANTNIKRILNELAENTGLKTTQNFFLRIKTQLSLTLPEPVYLEEGKINPKNSGSQYSFSFGNYPLNVLITDDEEIIKTFASSCTKEPYTDEVILNKIKFCKIIEGTGGMEGSGLNEIYYTVYNDIPVLMVFTHSYPKYPPENEVAFYKNQQKNVEKLIQDILKTVKLQPVQQEE